MIKRRSLKAHKGLGIGDAVESSKPGNQESGKYFKNSGGKIFPQILYTAFKTFLGM